MFSFLRFDFELPLLKRELLELAQRKRTYVLRCICLAIFTLVFMFAYMAMRQGSANVMRMLGHGREMMYMLFGMLLFTVYALAPALSCSAITSEKEKQTLGLLLTSRLTPFAIVLEKTFSRMVPLISLVVVSAPLFGLSYLFGGISFGEALLGVAFLLFVVFQVTAVAVFCSALVETSFAAFWLTYVVLVFMYFTLPILVGFGFLPDNLGASDINGLEFLLFPPYQIGMLSDVTEFDHSVWLLTLPSLLLTMSFPLLGWLALTRFAYGSATSAKMIMLRIQGALAEPMAWILPEGRLKQQAEQAIIDADSPLATRVSRDFPVNHPITWREKRGTALLRFRTQFLLLGTLFVMQGCSLSTVSSNAHNGVCALFSFGVLIISLLMVLSLAARLFAKERERQTLDTLLAAPLTNRDILRDKIAPINQAIMMLLLPVFMTGVFNVLTTRVVTSTLTYTGQFDDGNYSRWHEQAHGFDWLVASLVYLVFAVGNAFIYMHLVKWIAVFFGLKQNTLMKAMIGSLVTVLVLCFVPMILIALVLVSTNCNPNDFPFWFFSSPIMSVAFNEFHDLQEFWRRTYLPNSDVFVVLFNFAVWGGLALTLRFHILNRLPSLLGRIDQPDFFAPQIVARPPQVIEDDAWIT
jgi:ABC-type transport system involved in multi-copper enzyme maturation permease subunit